MCKISVLMGVYKPKKEWLDQSIRSVLEQTFQDFELIIVCDGCKETLPYLYEWEKRDDRVKILFYPQNRGLAYALNYALNCAVGEYIARQDDDDCSFPNRFAKQLDFLSVHDRVAFVCSQAELYDTNGVYSATEMPEKPNKKDFLFTCPFLHPTMLIRRDALIKIGGYRVGWDTKKAEDYDLYMRLYAKGFLGVNLQEKLYRYRFERTGKRKRNFLDRLGETWVRIRGFSQMKMGVKGFFYAFKPLIVWLLPQKMIGKRRKYIK